MTDRYRESVSRAVFVGIQPFRAAGYQSVAHVSLNVSSTFLVQILDDAAMTIVLLTAMSIK